MTTRGGLIRFDAKLATVSETGLALRDGLDFEQWQSIGTQLRRIEKAALWWLGDWLNYGERAYGEMYSQALEETDYTYDGLRAAKWVSERIETVRRRTNVDWSIHREVAALPSEQQDALLPAADLTFCFRFFEKLSARAQKNRPGTSRHRAWVARAQFRCYRP